MKIVIAPDSFKGSLSALEVAGAMKRGTLRVFPDGDVHLVPLGDGGEGTVDALVAAIPGSVTVSAEVTDPLGRPIVAQYGLLGVNQDVAIVEMAAASGITLITAVERNPMLTTTYGTGELLRHALATEGLRELIIGLGGSATNDGGAGALQALGVQFTSGNDMVATPACGNDVGRIDGIAFNRETLPVDTLQVTIACDVSNTLTGPNGASAVFGPQKGATAEMVKTLDESLVRFEKCLNDLASSTRNSPFTGSIGEQAGSGAAGGLAAGLIAFFPNARLKPGIEIVLDAVDFNRLVADADIVLTGEGKLDSQTLSGKAIDGVLRQTHKVNVPVIAFAGAVEAGVADALRVRGLQSAHGLMEIATSVEDAMGNAAKLLEELVVRVLTDLSREVDLSFIAP